MLLLISVTTILAIDTFKYDETIEFSMDKIDFKQIKKLPPEEKIKVLRQIEAVLNKLIAERKKEIEAKKKEIEESNEEISDKDKEIKEAEEMLTEAQNEFRVLEEIQKPELKKVEIEKLFRPKEEKEEGLEGIAAKAPVAEIAERQARIEELSKKPIEELYQTVVGMRKEIEKTGVETLYQQEKSEEISEALYEKRKAIESREYNPTAKAKHLMTAAEQMMENYL